MKKLIALSFVFLLGTISVLAANPLPLLIPHMTSWSIFVRLSDVDVTSITTFAANNQMALISSLINKLDIAQDIMVYPGVKNKIPMPKLKVGNGFRPYSGSEEFKVKNLKYTDRFLEVKVGKRELQIDPEDYRGTYLSQAQSPGSGSQDINKIPFAQFLWEQVIGNSNREINDETAYKGFDGSVTVAFDAGTVYNPGDRVTFVTATNNPNNVKDWYQCITLTVAGQTPDTHAAKWQNVTARAVTPGIESYVLAGITASEIAPVATGAITSTAGVPIAAFKKLFRAWSAAYKRNGIIISCSYTDYELLMDDFGDKYKALKDDASENGYLELPETEKKCFIKPATWLGTSRRLISGPVFWVDGSPKQMNLFMGTDILSDTSEVVVQRNSLWKLSAGIKAALGFNYQDPEGIKVGDQS